jgi:hypothetical protein
LDNPDSFYEIIPKTLQENIKFRMELHSFLQDDKEAQKVFLALCLANPKIMFNSTFWTYNPKRPTGYRHWPFILRPQQEIGVDELQRAIITPHDTLWEKSRDEGATELIAKMFVLYFLLDPECSFLVGSRKEDYVDGSTNIVGSRVSGSPKSIFHKILYGIAHLPNWMRVPIVKTHCHVENLSNGSVIDGEATNENFGAGDRRTAIMLDEFGRVDHKLAQNIRDSVADVSDCVIYNSTHFYGRGHPFYKLRASGKIKLFLMPWYKNPEKVDGLYKSPDLDQIEIVDIDYYRNICPEIFSQLTKNQPFCYSKFERRCLTLPVDIQQRLADVKFVADGSNKYRSKWYDKEVDRRDPKDVAQNIDMNPIGSGEQFFDMATLQRIRVESIRPPDYQGEILFETTPNKGQLTKIRFVPNFGKNCFKWWGKLVNGRPNQIHNYIVACDISMGTGASNSTMTVLNVNTYEKVGSFASPNLSPEDFAVYAVALCHWVGGATGKAFLTWESNGGQGQLFDKRRRFLGFNFVYIERDERNRKQKSANKYGWFSNRNKKFDMLAGLRAALTEGIKTKPLHKAIKIYDEDSLKEYEDYIFYENGSIGPSTSLDDSSGAVAAHGDRVIADGLAVLAMSSQRKASLSELARIKVGSILHRRFVRQQERRTEQENSPWI